MSDLKTIKTIIYKECLSIDENEIVEIGSSINSGLSFEKSRISKVSIGGEEMVIFCYPTLKNPSSGKMRLATTSTMDTPQFNDRIKAWNLSRDEDCKYFFLTAFEGSGEKYDEYVLSIEALNPTFVKNHIQMEDKKYLSVLENNNDKEIVRFKMSEEKIYLAFIKKSALKHYLAMFDNRPYMYADTKNKENILFKNIQEAKFEDFKTPINFERNRLIYGAPGTGKSYKLSRDFEKLSEKKLYDSEETIDKVMNLLEIPKDAGTEYEDRKNELKSINCLSGCHRVTFHPEYGYSDFVGCYKPKPKNQEDGITYEFVPGPFTLTLVDALKSPEKNYLLIIEEVNRANAASVFGDVFQMLDRNNGGYSEYSITPSIEMKAYLTNVLNVSDIKNIVIPQNLYLWATMNSADQGVYPMDSAFKRRWSFEYVPIDGTGDDEKMKSFSIKLRLNSGVEPKKCSWNEFRKLINAKLKGLDIEEDRLIGPRFLSETDLLEMNSEEAIINKLFAYLRQDVLRHNSTELFNEDLKNMADIRERFKNEKYTIWDILNIEKSVVNLIFEELDIQKDVLKDE